MIDRLGRINRTILASWISRAAGTLAKRRNVPTPTSAELAVLRVLWVRKQATVREVHDEIHDGAGTGYTSSLKIMQNMLAKGLVTRAADKRQHVYKPAVAERTTMNRIVGDWIDGAFAGSSLALAMQALDARPVDAEELAKLKALVARIEAGDT